MGMTRRDWLKGGAVAAVAGATAPFAAQADANTFWNQHRRPIGSTMTDVPSATLAAGGKILQPAREVPVYRTCDVLVVGGGIAGWAAAMSAAKAGRKTILVERDESLGGLWSNGGVLILLATGYLSNGRFTQTTRGFTDDLIKKLEAMGPMAVTGRARPNQMYLPTADPEALKIALEELLVEAGCEILYRCHDVDVVINGADVKGVVVESTEGRLAILAQETVDATGDGDVLFQAGEKYQQYKHGIGFTYRIGGFDSFTKEAFDNARKAGLWFGGNEPCSDNRWYGMFGVSPDGKANEAHNRFDVAGVSKIMMHHRAEAWKSAADLRKVKGCEKAHLIWTATQIGIRGARTLDGVKSIDRAWAAAHLEKDDGDTVAWMGSDGASPKGSRVPLGCLLPKTANHLTVCGRAASCADDMIDLFRLIAPCLVTGQAAGAASAVASRKGVGPRDVPVKDVQKLLLEQGAYLG